MSRKISLLSADKRPIHLISGIREHGRSTVYIDCPFCGFRNTAFVWSLAGSGKRCSNPSCRAFFSYFGFAYKD